MQSQYIKLLYLYSICHITPENPTKKQCNLLPLNVMCFGLITVMLIFSTSVHNKCKDPCPQYEKIHYEIYKMK